LTSKNHEAPSKGIFSLSSNRENAPVQDEVRSNLFDSHFRDINLKSSEHQRTPQQRHMPLYEHIFGSTPDQLPR
jgi:hypothetical protein